MARDLVTVHGGAGQSTLLFRHVTCRRGAGQDNLFFVQKFDARLGAMIYSKEVLLLRCRAAVLPCCRAAALPCCRAAVLLRCRAAVLPC